MSLGKIGVSLQLTVLNQIITLKGLDATTVTFKFLLLSEHTEACSYQD